MAEELNLIVHKYPARWDLYGSKAGPLRNRLMYKEHPDAEIVLAFHNNLRHSKGTYDIVYRVCLPARIKIINITEKEEYEINDTSI